MNPEFLSPHAFPHPFMHNYFQITLVFKIISEFGNQQYKLKTKSKYAMPVTAVAV